MEGSRVQGGGTEEETVLPCPAPAELVLTVS